MVIAINEASDIPIYMQIRNQIVQGISDGRLVPGEQLPTVRALAVEIGINSMTVSKAYQTLKQEGYIYADRRSGARIRESFSHQKGLSDNNTELLKQIISEAKINGVTLEDFLKQCAKLYQEGNTQYQKDSSLCQKDSTLCQKDSVFQQKERNGDLYEPYR